MQGEVGKIWSNFVITFASERAVIVVKWAFGDDGSNHHGSLFFNYSASRTTRTSSEKSIKLNFSINFHPKLDVIDRSSESAGDFFINAIMLLSVLDKKEAKNF
jgi:hypothetical protein